MALVVRGHHEVALGQGLEPGRLRCAEPDRPAQATASRLQVALVPRHRGEQHLEADVLADVPGQGAVLRIARAGVTDLVLGDLDHQPVDRMRAPGQGPAGHLGLLQLQEHPGTVHAD